MRMKRLLKELGIDLDSPRPLGTNRIRALKGGKTHLTRTSA
jgi:hypothetical protein